MNDNSTYFRNSRAELLAFLPKKYSRVLEIGCGEGHFRGNLKPGNEYWGVELIDSAAAVASTRLDRVLTGSFLDVCDQIPNGYFDLVICNDVIEHMPDHDQFLQIIKTKMREDGCLMGSLPNVRYLPNLLSLLMQKDWRYADAGILDRTHLRFFTERSIVRTFRENGYVIEGLSGITHAYRTGSILKRCLYGLVLLIVGRDAGFLQFGFRIRQTGQPHT